MYEWTMVDELCGAVEQKRTVMGKEKNQSEWCCAGHKATPVRLRDLAVPGSILTRKRGLPPKR